MNSHYSGLMNVEALEPSALSLFTKKQLTSLLQKFFKGEIKDNQIPDELFNATLDKMEEGILKVEYTDRDQDLIDQLKENVAVFSAFKSWRQSGELLASLLDSDGNKRTFADFAKEAAKIDAEYNRNWLEAEYNMAIRQARTAVQWKDFEAAKNVYPNLEYKASRSANPRDAHKAWYGLIKPIDDAFWDTAMPPNGWGCKCWVQQTKADADTKQVDAPEPIKGIAGNAGKTGQVFSKDHPYMEVSKEEKKVVEKEYKRLIKDRSNTN